MNVCPGEGVAYDSYYNETDRVSKNTFYSFICLVCSGCYSPCTTTTSSVEEIVILSELKLPRLLTGGIECPVSPWGLPQPWWHNIYWCPWVGSQDLNC